MESDLLNIWTPLFCNNISDGPELQLEDITGKLNIKASVKTFGKPSYKEDNTKLGCFLNSDTIKITDFKFSDIYFSYIDEKELDEKKKVELVDIIGEYDFRIVEGANERIQLEALIAQFMKFK